MTTVIEPVAVDAPQPTRAERIASELADERGRLLDVIAKHQMVRDDANARIKAARSELADVDRLLAATKPRTRTPKGT